MLCSLDHDLFLALNFDGGRQLDRLMLIVSDTPVWIPLYLLIFWLVGRRCGWRMLPLFIVLLFGSMYAADIVAGIFKHSGPLGGLLPDFAPRWRPMFTPALEGLPISPDSLRVLRAENLLANPAVHVPAAAVGSSFGTVSSHAATICLLAVEACTVIRRRWFTLLMIGCTALICYARIYLAKHFPTDLLLGAAVGLLVGWITVTIFRCIETRFAREN